MNTKSNNLVSDRMATKRDSIIIGVVSICGVMLAFLAVVMLYRRCKREFALVKTVVANSNSYKSAFGSKYQNVILVDM